VWGKQDYEKKMAHDMEEVQLRFKMPVDAGIAG
jgi:hypothetical protein